MKKEIIIEYIGYGLYDARVSEFETRGVGNSKLDALIDLLNHMKEEKLDSFIEYNVNIAV